MNEPRQISGTAEWPSFLQKTVTTLRDWLVVGPSPKIRDPHNSANGSGRGAGVQVNDRTAMGVSAFFACARLVSSSIGSLPLPVYRRAEDGIPAPARDSAIYKVLHESPNADQTPLDYLEGLALALVLNGNHYARKVRDGTRLIALEPVRPDLVSARRREDGRIGYRWSWNGEHFDLTEEDVFHVRGFGGGPLSGLSVIGLAKESLGIAIAADRAAGAMFRNGLRTPGGPKIDKPLSPEQRKDFYAQLDQRFGGPDNDFKPFLFEFGSSWESISINGDEAQLLQSRAWSVEEICRWFGVPPFMIGHNEKTTSWGSGIEQMLLGFQKFTLQPYLRRIEQAIRKQLLTPAERAQGLFAEFNLEGLLRADSQGRVNFYRGMTQIGAMTVNEVRAKENLAPIAGGDLARVQAQNIPLQDSLREALADQRQD